MGYIHNSNGRESLESRSLDRAFLRANYVTKFERHNVNVNFMIYQIYNVEETNKNIINHLGYWELTTLFSDLIVFSQSAISLEFRTYAGSQVFDLDQGATQIGLNLTFWSNNFNPSIYFQRFEGYSENLMNYDKKRTEYRLGLSLTF